MLNPARVLVSVSGSVSVSVSGSVSGSVSVSVSVVGAFLLAVGVRPAAAGDTWTGKVVAVADGDTITVLRDTTQVKIRLHGVDAPEKAQPFGDKAKQLTSSLVSGKDVRVEAVTRDRYGRTVARVYVTTIEAIDHPDDASHRPVAATRCLNEELLKAGLAWWYRQYSPRDGKLARLEEEARKAKRGLWADASPTPPWAWRHPDLVCRQDVDCVFLPSVCPGCAPCAPTPRRVGNRSALRRIQELQARVRCARPGCPACADEKNLVGGQLACQDGRCARARAAGRAAPTAVPAPPDAPYHGNVRSKVLHAPGCKDHGCRGCAARFKTVEDARRAGYRPHACVAAFDACHSACLMRQRLARAVAWEAIEAGCRRSCTP